VCYAYGRTIAIPHIDRENGYRSFLRNVAFYPNLILIISREQFLCIIWKVSSVTHVSKLYLIKQVLIKCDAMNKFDSFQGLQLVLSQFSTRRGIRLWSKVSLKLFYTIQKVLLSKRLRPVLFTFLFIVPSQRHKCLIYYKWKIINEE
jgi:hypothetical protein